MSVKVLCFFVFLFQTFHGHEVYNITSSTPLFANQTLVSSNKTFELVFFTPSATTGYQYVGIRYNKSLNLDKILWVANREKSVMLTGELVRLIIGPDGNLKLVDGQENVIWSTNVTTKSNNSYVELLDDGNLVLKDVNSNNHMWESFGNPCDTLLPGMKMGMDLRTGEKLDLVSWKSETDPSPGNFTYVVTSEIPPQAMGWAGSYPYWRSGQWDKAKFVGIDDMDESYASLFSLEQDPKKGTTYLSIRETTEISFPTLFISLNGTLTLIYWYHNGWYTDWMAPSNPCETYGACGPFGICNTSGSPICGCLTGYVPKSDDEWNKGNWTGGCIRQTTLNCQRSTNTSSLNNTFLKLSNMKLPDFANYTADPTDDQECQSWCFNNCSCQAYFYKPSIGCLIWIERLLDMQKFNTSGEDLFIRTTGIDLKPTKETNNSGGSNQRRKLISSVIAVLVAVILGVVAYGIYRRKAKQKRNFMALREQLEFENKFELPLFSFNCIFAATNNFNESLKLGQGGYGPVFKGMLRDGSVVAVKRLSSSSGQGLEEFKNEILLISKLQHRNLVKLVGCCIEREEKILVYEYLPNKSLDTFLYDSKRKAELDWNKRFNIVQGIARGLLYLHHDSCLRVIHRDLKVSNILLDEKMNPKISDFGLARMFQGTQVLVNTHKVVGTFGYMSPEYAMGGLYSEKLDVYSFGVLILEIVSGKKNSSFYTHGQDFNLFFHAWQLWSQGRGLELMDETLSVDSSSSEVKKCIHVGLLCVQDNSSDRPNMSNVVLMLSGESDLPPPKQPTFTYQNWLDQHQHVQSHEASIPSTNTITNSIVEGR